MKRSTYIIAIMVFSFGVLMLFGSSYSLIIRNLVSKESYGFEVANFDVQFSDNKKISISGIPESDEEGLANSQEFSFTVSNNSEYDVNYRIDILENNNTNMRNVIHYVYAINKESYSEVLSLKDNFTIKQNKVLKPKETDTYKIKMWLSLDADESYMNKSISANISLIATQNEYKYATTVIEKLANNKQDDVVSENKNYRYLSSNPKNYLWFNCQEGFSKGEDYCEKWQIIGSFMNKKEKAKDEYYMLKIVNSSVFSTVSFNNDDKKGDYDESYIETFANGVYYDKLSDSAKKYIMKAKWNIGGTTGKSYFNSLQDEKMKFYYGNIGLLNVSDYLFMKDKSFLPKENNIILLNKDKNQINVLKDEIIKANSNTSYDFLPCTYLRPDISIVSGDGSINNPYEIAIKYPMNY